MEFKIKEKLETKDESLQNYMICLVFFACTNAAIFVSKQGGDGGMGKRIELIVILVDIHVENSS